jgi:hypothetical protein
MAGDSPTRTQADDKTEVREQRTEDKD